MRGNKKNKKGNKADSKKADSKENNNKKEKQIPMVLVFNKSGKLCPDLLDKLKKLNEGGCSFFLLNTCKINESQARDIINLQNTVVEIHDYAEGKMKDISNQAEILFKNLEKILKLEN